MPHLSRHVAMKLVRDAHRPMMSHKWAAEEYPVQPDLQPDEISVQRQKPNLTTKPAVEVWSACFQMRGHTGLSTYSPSHTYWRRLHRRQRASSSLHGVNQTLGSRAYADA